jgi:lipoprotein-anchoring transpeptidase ErfK/SrfK
MRSKEGRARHQLVAALAGGALLGAMIATIEASSPGTSSAAGEAMKPASAAQPNTPRLPPPVKPAFVPGKPRLLGAEPWMTVYAPVRAHAVVRRAPDAQAASVGSVSTLTPEGTRNLVLVLGRATDGDARLWVRVRVAASPSASIGWLPRKILGGYETVVTRLVIDLRDLTATLYRRGRSVFHARVGVGRPDAPTPTGEFYVRNKLTRYANEFYGPVAFGTSARSSLVSDWPAGGFVGIHGTNRPDVVPGRVSHGCIRLRNEDVLELAKLMPVGTPLTIR